MEFAGDKLQSFVKATDGTWEQSPELKKVLSIMQDNTDKQINIEAAPSPMMLGVTSNFNAASLKDVEVVPSDVVWYGISSPCVTVAD